jgi:hypothetical protein
MPTPVTALSWEIETILGKIRVAEIFDKDHVVVAGKQADRVRARGVLAYWAIRDLGLTATEVGTYLGFEQIRCQPGGHKRPKTDCRSILVPERLKTRNFNPVPLSALVFRTVFIIFTIQGGQVPRLLRR